VHHPEHWAAGVSINGISSLFWFDEDSHLLEVREILHLVPPLSYHPLPSFVPFFLFNVAPPLAFPSYIYCPSLLPPLSSLSCLPSCPALFSSLPYPRPTLVPPRPSSSLTSLPETLQRSTDRANSLRPLRTTLPRFFCT
jgi:hypothetical protein